ncbi:hypothetical protein [Shewanella xiamenensis]|uniref:hypothetical protein n=1 Tax=Shewanella xiamenensis TaxID=332186 RepID=UPI000849E7DB|nr:hypothetical protein [Shewanella xiamenensis]ODR86718.1 phage-associated protein, BcepMu gp16 family [Shewanella xiamenensis]
MNKSQIHARLIERGSNFERFALQHGYESRAVRHAVERWAGSQRFPNGRLTFRILKDLSTAIGAEIIPGIFDEAA